MAQIDEKSSHEESDVLEEFKSDQESKEESKDEKSKGSKESSKVSKTSSNESSDDSESSDEEGKKDDSKAVFQMGVKRRVTMRNKEKDFDMNKLEIVHKP